MNLKYVAKEFIPDQTIVQEGYKRVKRGAWKGGGARRREEGKGRVLE